MKSEVKKSIDAKNDIIFSFDKISTEFEKELYDRLTELISKLSNQRGRILLTDDILSEVLAIVSAINKEYIAKGIPNKIKDLLKNFDDVTKSSIELVAMINGDLDFNKLNINAAKKLIIDSISDNLAKADSFKINVSNVIKRIIVKRALLGSTLNELRADLKNATIGDQKIFTNWGSQLIKDALYRYQGNINQQIYNEFNLNAISYVGGLKTTSRPQCIRWIEDKAGLLLKKETDLDITYGLLSEEIEWAKDNGSGYGTIGKTYYLNLTEENFLTIRGGYGCEHEAIPFMQNARQLERNERLKKAFDAELERIGQKAA